MIDVIADISHHNGGSLNFGAAAAAGMLGIVQKATQGTTYKDPTYFANRAGILAAGLRFGSYHFGTGEDGGTQADAYLAAVGPQQGELLTLDFESNPAGPSMTLEEARAFVTRINSVVGKWPVLYAGHDLKDQLGGHPDPVLANCPLWLAQYGPSAVLPPGWATWTLWQYTDGSVGPSPKPVPGIGHCDREQYIGTAADLPGFWSSVSA